MVPAILVGLSVSAAALGATTVLGVTTEEVEARVHQDEAQREIAAGQQALRESRWNDAVGHFRRALDLSPGNGEALAGLEQAQDMINQGGLAGDAAQEDILRQQQSRQEFDAAMQNASQLLEQGQFTEARQTALAAQIQLSQGTLPQAEVRERSQRAEQLIDEIDRRQEEQRLIDMQTAEEERKARADEEARAEAEKRAAQVNQNLIRVRELQLQRNYDEALSVIDQILFLDSGNPVALALKDAIQTAQLWQSFMDSEREREFSYSWQFQNNREATLAPRPNFSGPGMRSTTGLMSYPEDWPQISIMRAGDASVFATDADRSVAAAIDNTLLHQVQIQDNTFEQVLAYLHANTQVNVNADWKSLELIDIYPDTRVANIQLRDVPARVLLERVLDQVSGEVDRAAYAVQDGMVIVSSEDAIREHVMTLVYDIRDLLFEVPYFDNAPTLDLSKELNGIPAVARIGEAFNGGQGVNANSDANTYGAGRSGRDLDGLFSDGGANPDRMNREDLVGNIVAAIQNHIDRDGWRDFGGDAGSIQELGGNLIITQTPRNHRSIQGLLSQLREIRALQINIESRFLTVDMNWFEKIGFDLDLYFNTNNTLFQQARASDPLFQLGDFFTGRGRVKDPLVFDGINSDADGDGFPDAPPGNTINYGNSFGFNVDSNGDGIPDAITYGVGPVGPPIRNTQGFSPFGITQDSMNLVDLLGGFAADSFAGTILAGNPALVMGIQFLDDIQIDLLIEATQADRRNVVLTAPRLTLFNGQRAWVLVGTQQAIVTALIPVVGDNSGAFQPVINTLTDGVVLDVEAVISADRRYVTLTVITGLRETVNIETLEFTGGVGGGGIGGQGTEFRGSVSLPEVEVSLVNTTTSVPDRGTVLIGGQRLVREVEVETGVPILSKIPFINRFFTNRVTTKDESTLLILIRPEIIIQQENEDLLFPGLSDMLGSSF